MRVSVRESYKSQRQRLEDAIIVTVKMEEESMQMNAGSMQKLERTRKKILS